MQAPEASLSEFLRRYTPAVSAPVRDMIDGRYRIELARPLPEYDTKTARAFAATDTRDDTRGLYALVCRPGTLQRHRAIAAVKNLNHPNVLPLIAAGPVPLSQPQEERFVIVYRMPPSKNLAELLANTPAPLSETFLSKGIVAPIASAVQALSELGVMHGRINPENIYFDDTPILGDFLSEPCGLSQPFYFEPLERIQAMPSAKGESTVSGDYYALAVLVLYLLHRAEHFAELTPQEHIMRILREGAYNALSRNRDNPEIFYDFFRGMLNQNVHDRWSDRHLKPWLEGKRYNVLLPPPPAEAIRPFEFNGEEANTRRELAHLFFNNWAGIAPVIQDGKLQQWVSVSLRNKELAEQIARITRAVSETASKNEVHLNEQLMRVLVLLDPIGPVRMVNLAFHIDGVDALCVELINNKADAELNLLARYIEFNMVNFWIDVQRRGVEFQMPPAVNTAQMRMDRVRMCIRNTGLGFGLERMLYELAPDMPCQSPLFAGLYVGSLGVLLTKLDQLAPSLSGSQDPIDRHIAAYVASKINIQHEIKLPELEGIPALAGHKTIVALRLLAMAQDKSGSHASMPGLSHWLGMRILPALDGIRSKSLRNRIKTALGRYVQSGSLSQMSELLINSNYAGADKDGYNNAVRTYNDSIAKARFYREGANIEQHSQHMGFVIAKILSYCALIISLLQLLKDLRA